MTVAASLLALLLSAAPQTVSPHQPDNVLPPTLTPEYVSMADSADYYIARSMWADAKRCTLEALRIDPGNFNNSLLLSNLGIINVNLGLERDAVANFTLGLNIAPASTTLRTNRAKTLLSLGEYAGAAEDLRILIEANPDDDWARKMYGVTFLANGDKKNAMEQFRVIGKPDADTLRMMAEIAAGNGDRDEALALYDKLVETSPSDESYADRALFLIAGDRTSEAAEDIKKGLAVNDKNPTLYLLRAYLRTLMHENSLAEEDKKIALHYGIDPQLVEALFPTKGKRK